MKILLTGADGQVGGELSGLLKSVGEVVSPNIAQCDFSNLQTVRNTIQEIQPDIIVNAAAYTAVDKAESNESLATMINGSAVGVLAEEAKKIQSLLIHYSTDYVFDGTKTTPYVENDLSNPINAYGRGKLAGEQAIRESGCDYYIIRTSWVHSSSGENFIKTMIRLASERDELKVVSDQIGSPTSAKLIAEGTLAILRADLPSTRDTFHLTASGETNWYEYAKLVLQVALDEQQTLKVTPDLLQPILTSNYKTAAKRPLNSRLSTNKLCNTIHIDLPSWEVGVVESVEGIFQCQH